LSLGIFISGLVLSIIILVPLGLKWQIEKNIVITSAFLIGIFAGAVTEVTTIFWNLSWYQILILQIFIIVAVSTSMLLWRFYRDPERMPPEDDNVILSPADGKVIYIKKINAGEIPFSEKGVRRFSLHNFVESDVLADGGYLIGIAMNFLDVHVNRAPIGGKSRLIKHIKGNFLSLKKIEAIIENERLLTVIDNGDFRVGVVQIASRLVRKIVCYIQEGQKVKKGQRIGMIRFGSQVDLVLPDLAPIRIKATPGTKVKAGISVLATYVKNK
jgi:phosphatidylserine decarboxylase